jgi:glycolate oxidase iron-sulfur subunit
MQHRIESGRHGPRGEPMARAVESCVHCGFCLPACPTYSLLGEEMDSPRGRIFLMKEVLEGSLPLAEARPYVDRCLGCLACEPACPSGVAYRDLVTPFRALAEARRSVPERGWRAFVLATLAHRARLRVALGAARALSWTRPLLPRRLRAMLDLAPPRLPRVARLPEVTPAHGARRARVALLAGCAQEVLAPEINRAALRVLSRNGVEVVVPRAQGCCGALALHGGVEGQARRLAERTLRAFPWDIDAVLTTAAGCGSGIHDYALLLRGEALEEEARRFAARVRDVASFLDELGIVPPRDFVASGGPRRIAYHDACHLAHAQGVREAPRRLLAAIPGVEVVTPAAWESCCGSAGTYNVFEPEIAAALGERKARSLLATGAGEVATGNIGCIVQIRRALERLGVELPLAHTIEVLERAYRSERD